MLTAALIIYFILAILLGLEWPFAMFAKGGPLGKIIVLAWLALLIAGIAG